METQHWIDEALDCRYLDPKQAEKLTKELLQIGRMLNSMMTRLIYSAGKVILLSAKMPEDTWLRTDD